MGNLEYERLRDISSSAKRSLEELVGGKIPFKPEAAGPALWQDIMDCCVLLLQAYAGGKVRDVRDFFGKLVRGARGIPLLEFRAPFDPPIDLFPVFATDRDLFASALAGPPVADRALNCFLGLRVATRTVSNALDTAATLSQRKRLGGSVDEVGRISVNPLVNRHLAGVTGHLAALRNLPGIDVAAVLPDGDTPGARWLANRLLQNRTSDSVHVVAHCRIAAAGEDPSSSAFWFSRQRFNRDQFVVPQRLLTLLDDDLSGKDPYGPLCVVIACGASDDVSASPASFPSLLRKAGHRCVVAPFVTVRVDPSYRLVEEFYQKLMGGESVAVALVKAREALVRRTGTPIGLMFAAHGDSHLSISAPETDSAQPA